MKVYVVEYDFKYIKVGKIDSDDIEHRVEYFTDLSEFIARVKYLKENDTVSWGIQYILNLKTYSGVLDEIDPEKVINPF